MKPRIVTFLLLGSGIAIVAVLATPALASAPRASR